MVIVVGGGLTVDWVVNVVTTTPAVLGKSAVADEAAAGRRVDWG